MKPLLPQPGGFEGFGLRLKRVPPGQLAVSPSSRNEELPLKGRAAARALTAKTSAQERHLPTLPDLVDLGPDIWEDGERLLPPPRSKQEIALLLSRESSSPDS